MVEFNQKWLNYWISKMSIKIRHVLICFCRDHWNSGFEFVSGFWLKSERIKKSFQILLKVNCIADALSPRLHFVLPSNQIVLTSILLHTEFLKRFIQIFHYFVVDVVLFKEGPFISSKDVCEIMAQHIDMSNNANDAEVFVYTIVRGERVPCDVVASFCRSRNRGIISLIINVNV